MGRPFIFKFKNKDKRYLYDVNANQIMEVDECLFSIIDHVDIDCRGSCFVNPRNGGIRAEGQGFAFAEADIRRTLDTIATFHREKGFFSNHRPSQMAFPFSKRELGYILEHLVGHVILNITENCNLRCSYCKFSGKYSHARIHSGKRMNESVALRAVQFMLDRSDYLVAETTEGLAVGFYGGEPLLNFPVIRACKEYVHEHCPQIEDRITFSLTTNMTIENDRVIDYLVDHGFYVMVSLDGPEDMHDRYRRSKSGRGSFQQVMQNLRRIKARNAEYFTTKLGFSVVMAPPYDLNALIDFFGQAELAMSRKMMWSFVDDQDTTFFNEFADLDSINSDLRTQLDELRARFESQLKAGSRARETELLTVLFGDQVRDLFMRNCVHLPDAIYPNGNCIPGFQKVFVSPDGRFYMCEKIGYDLPMGDLDRGFDVDAIYSAIDDYISISKSKCLDCWALRLCKMCFVKALRAGQFDAERKEENCRAVKAAILRSLRSFSEIMNANPSILAEIYNDTHIARGMEVPFQFIQKYRHQLSGNGAEAGFVES